MRKNTKKESHSYFQSKVTFRGLMSYLTLANLINVLADPMSHELFPWVHYTESLYQDFLAQSGNNVTEERPGNYPDVPTHVQQKSSKIEPVINIMTDNSCKHKYNSFIHRQVQQRIHHELFNENLRFPIDTKSGALIQCPIQYNILTWC